MPGDPGCIWRCIPRSVLTRPGTRRINTPGTQTGQKLRLREKGVPSAAHEGKRGDQIVEVKVVVPKLQDERSKEILRELAKLNPEEPREGLFASV